MKRIDFRKWIAEGSEPLDEQLTAALEGREHQCEFDGVNTVLTESGRYCAAPITHHVTLGQIVELLEKVGMKADDMYKYAYEFSGGQRQRIGIARALAVKPEFLLCDEPISALDVSIQAQVVNMLEDLQQELGLTYLFVAHDLSMVRHISTRIGVMYLGKIVEIAESDELYDNPLHPYTEALLSAIPVADPKTARSSKRKIIEGDLPSPMNVPSGCRFHTRCPYAKPECSQSEPQLVEKTPGHFVACHNI